MSHPTPGHDYSERHNEETSKEYSKRMKSTYTKKKHDNSPSTTHRVIEGVIHSGLKKAFGSKSKALKKKISKGRRTSEEEGESRSDFERGN